MIPLFFIKKFLYIQVYLILLFFNKIHFSKLNIYFFQLFIFRQQLNIFLLKYLWVFKHYSQFCSSGVFLRAPQSNNICPMETLPFKPMFFYFSYKFKYDKNFFKSFFTRISVVNIYLNFCNGQKAILKLYNSQYCYKLMHNILPVVAGVRNGCNFIFQEKTKRYIQNCFFILLTSLKFINGFFDVACKSKLFFWKRDLNLFPREQISTINLFLYYFSFFTNNYYFKNALNIQNIQSYDHSIILQNFPARFQGVNKALQIYSSKKFYIFFKHSCTKNETESLNKFKDLSVFQLKPGYKRLWKMYRGAHAAISPYSFFRQRRWTRYFLSLSQANSSNLLNQLEFSLFWILYSSYLFFSQHNLLFFIFKRYIYINGILPNNPNSQIFLGDVIQLRVDVNSVLYLLKYNFFFLKIKKKTLFTFFFNLNKNYVIKNSWQLKISFFFDIPNYLEIDFLSLSIIPIYYPIFHFEQQPFVSYYLPASAIKVYNWKYVN